MLFSFWPTRVQRTLYTAGYMKKDSEHPEFIIGAFWPIGLGLAAVLSGILFLVTGGPLRVVFMIVTVLLISAASAILGAIWMSRRQQP